MEESEVSTGSHINPIVSWENGAEGSTEKLPGTTKGSEKQHYIQKLLYQDFCRICIEFQFIDKNNFSIPMVLVYVIQHI